MAEANSLQEWFEAGDPSTLHEGLPDLFTRSRAHPSVADGSEAYHPQVVRRRALRKALLFGRRLHPRR